MNRNCIRVAAAQIEVRELKIEHNKNRILHFLGEAKQHKVDIVCFCEGALTGWIRRKGEDLKDKSDFPKLMELKQEIDNAIEEIKNACKKNKVNAVVGLSYPISSYKAYNLAYVIDKNGKIVHKHSKNLLTEFEKEVYSGYCDYRVFEFEGFKCGIAICFEFEANHICCLMLQQMGAEIIFNPKHHRSLSGEWMPNACEIVFHKTRCRAMGHQVYVISVNRAVESELLDDFKRKPFEYQMSHSMIVGPNGIVENLSYPTKEDLIITDIQKW